MAHARAAYASARIAYEELEFTRDADGDRTVRHYAITRCCCCAVFSAVLPAAWRHAR